MGFQLPEWLRFAHGGNKKKTPAFKTEKEAYDFLRSLYNKSGGVNPELQKAYEFYKKHIDDDCEPTIRPRANNDQASAI